ncbi:MAG: RNA 2',3'-cyclic phosphodiesterase [Gemmataceae bacterium]
MSRLRTFIAVEVEPHIRERLSRLQETLARAAPDVKWVDEENLHVTLVFLGDVDEREIPAVCRVVQEICAEIEPFLLHVGGVGCFPNPRRPRTIWAGLGEGAEQLVQLHGRLEAALVELGCYRREERQFTPHITLGRLKGELRTPEKLPEALTKQAAWVGGECQVEAVLVLSSQLTPQGPIYSTLCTAPLAEP